MNQGEHNNTGAGTDSGVQEGTTEGTIFVDQSDRIEMKGIPGRKCLVLRHKALQIQATAFGNEWQVA